LVGSGVGGIGVGGISVGTAVAGGSVGAGMAAGAQADKTRDRIKPKANRVFRNERFIFPSLV